MSHLEINMLAYKRTADGGLTALEMPNEPVHSYGVYVIEYPDDDTQENAELEDHDCPTIEQANEVFSHMLNKYPGAEENIYSMPNLARHGEAGEGVTHLHCLENRR